MIRLFVGRTCALCPAARRVLDEHGLDYNEVVVDDDVEAAVEAGVRSVPTVVYDDLKYAGLAAIKEFADEVVRHAQKEPADMGERTGVVDRGSDPTGADTTRS